jgi:DNA-binding CsgD family transcriptional regulator
MGIFSSMDGVDWRKLCVALEAIETERGEEGFLRRSLEQVQTMIPFDHAFACKAHASVLASGDYPYSPPVYVNMNQEESFWSAYCLGDKPDDLLINQDPSRFQYSSHPRLISADWARAAGSGEVGTLLAKYRTRYSLNISNIADTRDWGFRLGFFREKKPFTERECDIMTALYPHLHNLCRGVMCSQANSRDTMRLVAAGAGLSRREVEVAWLLAGGLSSGEMAERLFISRKTVSKHLEHIYDKLQARGRRGARRLLAELAHEK